MSFYDTEPDYCDPGRGRDESERVDPPTCDDCGRTIGMGLVSLQGGRCGYEPAEDDRAIFFFTLPALPAPRKEIQQTATTRRMLAGSGAT